MLSQSGEYALQAVLYLAGRESPRPVGAGEIAAALGVPGSYLAKLLHTLVQAGVLASTRGRNGGFALAVAADKLRLVSIVTPFDDGSERRHCLLGRSTCSDRAACAAHFAWKNTADAIANFFRTTTVAAVQRSGALQLTA